MINYCTTKLIKNIKTSKLICIFVKLNYKTMKTLNIETITIEELRNIIVCPSVFLQKYNLNIDMYNPENTIIEVNLGKNNYVKLDKIFHTYFNNTNSFVECKINNKIYNGGYINYVGIFNIKLKDICVIKLL